MSKTILLVATVMFIAGCDQDVPEKTVWDEQLKTMDKAQDAEQQMLEAAELQRRAIEQQTQQ
ncbi:MAG: hypothetical protein VYB22_02475 [Pseudomonadota bacterium]|nr:hypothetical protein [Pseudomonadota bacterium]